MSKLAREELRHFEQVRTIMTEMGVPFEKLSASRYAGRLRDAARPAEPQRLLDSLLIGALIEARSCERFAALRRALRAGYKNSMPVCWRPKHVIFEHYMALARSVCDVSKAEIDARLEQLKDIEAALVRDADPEFRFHSGKPI